MKIVVDAMGGDYAPQTVVAGVVEAVKEFDVTVLLVGIREQVEQELSKYSYPKARIEVLHAPEVVDMHDSAASPLRKKRNSSISIGINLLKDPAYDAFISAGNTGAVVAASTVFLGMLKGIDRPGIGLVIPTLNKFSFIIDVGANTDPKQEHLIGYAVMSRVYSREVLGVENPSVGLLNIGTEEGKGTDFEKEMHKIMVDRVTNFIGNLEANEIFSGKCDCIISDGYVGNIALKVAEGVLESAGALIKREVKKDPLALLGAGLMKWRLDSIKKFADYSEYGGAPLLGVNGIVMISHGRSSAKAIKNAIRATKREVEHKLLSVIAKETALLTPIQPEPTSK